jgi:hypothetical protein
MDNDFLPDEFVLDDVPDPGHAPTIVFAGPSDPPPVLHPPPARPPGRANDRLYFVIGAGFFAAAAVLAVTLRTRRAAPSSEVEAVFVVESPPVVNAPVVRHASPGASAASLAPPSESLAIAPPPASRAVAPPSGTLALAAPTAGSTPDGGADAEGEGMDEATQAKQDAEKALEKGHAAQAIEAGERSVALDPTDAEAWLILGAGYDQRGAFAQARRCFATCAKVATRGPRRECAALLR